MRCAEWLSEVFLVLCFSEELNPLRFDHGCERQSWFVKCTVIVIICIWPLLDWRYLFPISLLWRKYSLTLQIEHLIARWTLGPENCHCDHVCSPVCLCVYVCTYLYLYVCVCVSVIACYHGLLLASVSLLLLVLAYPLPMHCACDWPTVMHRIFAPLYTMAATLCMVIAPLCCTIIATLCCTIIVTLCCTVIATLCCMIIATLCCMINAPLCTFNALLCTIICAKMCRSSIMPSVLCGSCA